MKEILLGVTVNVEIYNWIRNNVEWQPTWGGQQTADMTLDVRRGNAMDIATLQHANVVQLGASV